MPVPVVAESLMSNHNNISTQVLNTAAGTAVGDTLVVVYGSDFYTIDDMPDPTSSAGTLTQIAVVNMGDNNGHIKAYTVGVTSGGSKSVTIPAHIDCDIFGVVLRISSSVTADSPPASNVDTSGGTASHVAPSVNTAGADRLLVCTWLVISNGTGFASGYTLPGGMTSRGEIWASPWAAMHVATEGRPTQGATGTRTATWGVAKPYCALSFAVGAAAASSPTRPPRALSQYGGFF